MRILALDVGSARIGVAVSDPSGTIAQAVAVIPRRGWRRVRADIEAQVAACGAERIVVGLPLRLDGTEGASAVEARAFAEKLQASLGVPVELQDERLSTAAAERAMIHGGARRARRRVTRDAVAAALFLQTYLDRRR